MEKRKGNLRFENTGRYQVMKGRLRIQRFLLFFRMFLAYSLSERIRSREGYKKFSDSLKESELYPRRCQFLRLYICSNPRQ